METRLAGEEPGSCSPSVIAASTSGRAANQVGIQAATKVIGDLPNQDFSLTLCEIVSRLYGAVRERAKNSRLFNVEYADVLGIPPNTGEVRSNGADGIACWFIDTDYNEESFFVRHAYFLGPNDPYKALRTTLKTEINEDACATLNSDTSRAFDKPKSGRIAVTVINHLGNKVMKVFRV